MAGWNRAALSALVGAAALAAGCVNDATETGGSLLTKASTSPVSLAMPAASAEVGHSYRTILYTHCGIDIIAFGGRNWRAETPMWKPPREGDSWPNESEAEITSLDRDTLKLVIDEDAEAGAGVVVTLHLTEEELPGCD